MKTLFLRKNSNDYFLKYIKEINDIYEVRKNNIIFRFVNKFFKSFLPFFYGQWKKDLKKVERIVIFDFGYDEKLVKYIKKKNMQIKIIFYYWNKISEKNFIYLNDKNISEFYTFNYEDSLKYKLKFNPQFYSFKVPIKKMKINNSIVFLGIAKNRENKLKELKDFFNSNKISNNICIIKDYKDFIKYDDYLKLVNQSKCILELCIDAESGLTLRALEALFFDKKLITNYKNITMYDFYDKNNIFILGQDDLKNIKEFIESPVKVVSDKIKLKYDFEAWKNNFN